MPIKNLDGKVSREDKEKLNAKKNHPEYESGFEPTTTDDNFFQFDDIESSGFGQPSSTDDIFGSSFSSGGFDSFGQSGSVFGNTGVANQTFVQPEAKPDMWDKLFEFLEDITVGTGKLLIEIFTSFGNRCADDVGYLGSRLVNVGAIGIVGGSIGAILAGVGGFGFMVRPLIHVAGGFGMAVGIGIVSMGISAYRIAKFGVEVARGGNTIPDLPSGSNVNSTYSDEMDGIYNDLFGDTDTSDDDDSMFKSLFDEDEEEDTYTSSNTSSGHPFDETEKLDVKPYEEKKSISFNEEEIRKNIDNIHETVCSRRLLFETFKSFLPTKTPNFNEVRQIYSNSDEFESLEAICLKALANIAKTSIDQLDSYLESAEETYFSYKLRLRRVVGLSKTDEIGRELEIYFREDSSDKGVTATVDIEGDFYKITVSKGVTAIVTIGDCIKQHNVEEFILDENNKLPLIIGVDSTGEVICDDGKYFDTMMIAGMPRSGKSWYVLSIVMAMMLFNTPEDVQFVIIDPKRANLFNTLALMPHVAGLHDDINILDIMHEIIDGEGERRKKLLADNHCDSIWELRDMGIRIPILYLVIDEVITVKNNLGDANKEFDALMQTMISMLPYVGIRLLFVPHRATGIINKTNRTMIQYAAAVRSKNEDVLDTLGIKKWTKELTNVGDIAVKTCNDEMAKYVRGVSLTDRDDTNAKLIKSVATAYYKMGVDLPDNTYLGAACNRDEDYIKQQLATSGTRLRYDAYNVLDGIE